jgi:hypothetical protein
VGGTAGSGVGENEGVEDDIGVWRGNGVFGTAVCAGIVDAIR